MTDLIDRANRQLIQCGSCDFAIGGCTCPSEDPRSVITDLVAEVEKLRDRLGDFEALARAAIHYVNCPQTEAETGEPWDALVHVVRVHERKAKP